MRELIRLCLLVTVLGGALFLGCGSDDDGGMAGPTPKPTEPRIYFAGRDTDCNLSSLAYFDVGSAAAVTITTLNGPDSVADLAVDEDDGYVYYTFSQSVANSEDSIRRIRIDGTGAETLLSIPSSGNTPRGITLDSELGAMYWIENAGCSPCPGCGSCSELRRAGLDGSNATTIATIGDTRNPNKVVIDTNADRLYFTDFQYSPHISRVDSDGGNEFDVYTGASGVDDIEVDLADGKLYWIESGNIGDPVLIRRSNLDGTGTETILTAGGSRATTPRGIAIDPAGGKLYWTESGFCGDTPSGRIRRANLDGSDPETILGGLKKLIGIEIGG